MSQSSLGLLNPLSYMGVSSRNPPGIVTRQFPPTSNDIENFLIGTMWIDTTNDEAYMLVSKSAGVATWKELTLEAEPFEWSVVTSTDGGSLVPQKGVISDNASLVIFRPPPTASIGDTYKITGKGTGGWRVRPRALQTIHRADESTTTGTSGQLNSTGQFDSIELVCTATNSDFNVTAQVGTLTVV